MKGLLLLACVVFTTAQRERFYESCGVAPGRDSYIIGGQEAEPNAYPWMVSLQGLFPDSHYCGGSIVTPEWVITAAHCVDGSSPSSITVAAGEHDFGDNDEATYVDVIDVVVHPDFVFLTLESDFAMLQLAEPLTFSDKIGAICAPDPSNTYLGETAIVSGWGNLDNQGRDYPDELYYVEVDVISNEECNDDYADYALIQISENMICAGDKVSVDACQGDSGGPLFVYDSDGYPILIGIVSGGIGCAEGYPGFYARVGEFVDFACEYIGC